MSKKILVQQTNGHAEEVGKPTKRTKLERLQELQEQIQSLQNEELERLPKKRGRKPKHETTQEIPKKEQVVNFKEKILNLPYIILLKEKNALVRKRVELEKTKKEQERTIHAKQEEIQDLQHTISESQQALIRTFDSSKILQIVEPTLRKSKNPIRAIKFLQQYRKEKKQYDTLVREIDSIPFVPHVSRTETQLQLENDPSRKYKIDFLTTHRKHLEVGDKYVRLYYLADLPAYLHQTVYFKIMAYGLPFQFSVFVKPAQRNVLLKQIRRRISSLQAKQNERVKKGLIRDPEDEKAIEEAETFAQELTYEVERGMVYALTFALEASSKEELDAMHKDFINMTDGMEMVFNTYTYGQKQAFKNFMPFGEDHVNENKLLVSTAVSFLMPFVAKQLYDPHGIYLGVNVFHNSQVYINPFQVNAKDINNSNINIFGQSGMGKSVTAKLLATRMYMRGTQIIIIDPEREYSELAEALGGEVIKFSRENGINPFYVHGKTKSDMLDHILTLKTFLKFFIPIDKYDSAEMDDYLVTLYEKEEKQDFPTLLKLMKKSPMYRHVKVLNEGSLKGIFTADRKLALDRDVVVFDLYDLKRDEKREPAMYLLTSLIWNLVNTASKKNRMLFIDEAHKLLKDREVAVFFYEMVKQARKRNLGVVSITQDVKDFLGNEWGNAVITNSETKIILKQSYANLPYMDNIYPMTDSEKEAIGNFKRGEALVYREGEHLRVDIDVLPYEADFIQVKKPTEDED